MNIIFIAAPAAGKGTQGNYLERECGYYRISTGDLLRKEIAKKTALGADIENIISKGELISDKIINTLLINEFKKINGKKFILDGYPRTLNQAISLDDIIDIDNTITIYLDIDLETAKERSLGRLICPKCGTSYSKDNPELMPKKNDICDDCHVKLIVRDDDNEETFKKRFDTFLEETKPVLSYYQYKKKLYKIDARLDDDDIFENIKKILKSVDVDKK